MSHHFHHSHHSVMPPDDAGKLVRSATWAALLTAAFLVFVKFYAWWITGSLAVLGILIDAVLDSVSSLAIFFAVRYAQTPADAEHRFGHGKAEALASLFVGGLMAATALFLCWSAIGRLIAPQPVAAAFLGVAAIMVVMVVSALLILYQSYVIRRTGSVAIHADSLHYRADFLLHGSVLAGLFGVEWFGVSALDALCGLGIGFYIGYESWRVVRGASDQLLDHEISDGLREAIRLAARRHDRVLDIHDLRTRRAGQRVFVQMHIELPPEMSLLEAHRVSDEVEASVVAVVPGAEVLIHQDPAGLEETTQLERS